MINTTLTVEKGLTLVMDKDEDFLYFWEPRNQDLIRLDEACEEAYDKAVNMLEDEGFALELVLPREDESVDVELSTIAEDPHDRYSVKLVVKPEIGDSIFDIVSRIEDGVLDGVKDEIERRISSSKKEEDDYRYMVETESQAW